MKMVVLPVCSSSAFSVSIMICFGVLQRLLEGRINQLKGTVTITKCAHRTFAAAQWKELRDQLAAWKVTPLPPPSAPHGLLACSNTDHCLQTAHTAVPLDMLSVDHLTEYITSQDYRSSKFFRARGSAQAICDAWSSAHTDMDLHFVCFITT